MFCSLVVLMEEDRFGFHSLKKTVAQWRPMWGHEHHAAYNRAPTMGAIGQ
jgi:hypothetical protein